VVHVELLSTGILGTPTELEVGGSEVVAAGAGKFEDWWDTFRVCQVKTPGRGRLLRAGRVLGTVVLLLLMQRASEAALDQLPPPGYNCLPEYCAHANRPRLSSSLSRARRNR
jgi:hypothetical protein